MRKQSIFLAILNEGTIRVELSKLINYWQMKNDYDITIAYPNDKPIEANRNRLVSTFMKTNCDWLVQIDDDVVPPPNYLDLILYNKDVISGVCYAYRQDAIVPLVLERNEEDGLWKNMDVNPTEGLIEVDSTGTGAMIIHRRVFENPEMLKHPFMSIWNEDGTRKKGLDLMFCEKAKANGFKVWMHLQYKCSHIVEVDLMEIERAMIMRELKGGAIDNNYRMRRIDAQTPPNVRKKFVIKK
jgi:hypothetical protein